MSRTSGANNTAQTRYEKLIERRLGDTEFIKFLVENFEDRDTYTHDEMAEAWYETFPGKNFSEVAARRIVKNKSIRAIVRKIILFENLIIDRVDDDVKRALAEELLSRIPIATNSEAVKIIHEVALLLTLFTTSNASTVKIEWADMEGE